MDGSMNAFWREQFSGKTINPDTTFAVFKKVTSTNKNTLTKNENTFDSTKIFIFWYLWLTYD